MGSMEKITFNQIRQRNFARLNSTSNSCSFFIFQNWHQKPSKFQFIWKGPFESVFNRPSCCCPSYKTVITKNHYHCTIIQDRDLQKQAPTTKFGSIFNLNMLSTILDVNHYKKSQNGCHSSIVQDRHLGCQLLPMANNMNANLINDGHQPRIFKFSKFSNV